MNIQKGILQLIKGRDKMKGKIFNIISYKKDGWYFADDIYSKEYGPYKSLRKATKKCKRYIRALNKKKRKKGRKINESEG